MRPWRPFSLQQLRLLSQRRHGTHLVRLPTGSLETLRPSPFQPRLGPDSHGKPPPYAINEILELQIIKANIFGYGVGFGQEGWPIFVPNALEDELVSIRIKRLGATFLLAELIDIKSSPNPKRIQPKCKLYQKCGGCTMQHLEYKDQLDRKRQYWMDSWARFTRLHQHITTEQRLSFPLIVPSSETFHYRPKIKANPVRSRDNRSTIKGLGFQARDLFNVINIPQCQIATEKVNRLYQKQRERLIGSDSPERVPVLHESLLLTGNQDTCLETLSVGKESQLTHLQHSSYMAPSMQIKLIEYIKNQLKSSNRESTLVDPLAKSGRFSFPLRRLFKTVSVNLPKENFEIIKSNSNGTKDFSHVVFRQEHPCAFIAQEISDPDHTVALLSPSNMGIPKNVFDSLRDTHPKTLIYIGKGIEAMAKDLQGLIQPEESESTRLSRNGYFHYGGAYYRRVTSPDAGGLKYQVHAASEREVSSLRKRGVYKIKSLRGFDTSPQRAEFIVIAVLERL